MLQNPFLGIMYKAGQVREGSTQGRRWETPGSYSGEGTVPTAVEILRLPSRRTRQEEKGQGGSWGKLHGGLCVKPLVRINTSKAHLPLCLDYSAL